MPGCETELTVEIFQNEDIFSEMSDITQMIILRQEMNTCTISIFNLQFVDCF